MHFTKVKLRRRMKWEARNTHTHTHTYAQKNKVSLGYTHTWALSTDRQAEAHNSPSHSLSDMDKLFIVHTLKQLQTHTLLVLCLQRLVVLSLWPAPPRLQPLVPKRERGLTPGPRHSLGCFCVDGAEGGGIMPFYVSEHRHDAMYLSSETCKCKGNKW